MPDLTPAERELVASVRLTAYETDHARRLAISRRQIALIVAQAAAAAGLPVEEVRRARTLPATSLRQYCYLLASERGLPVSAIGRWFDRDHSSVLHGIKVARARREASLCLT